MKKRKISKANKEIITVFFLLVFVLFFINSLIKPNFILMGIFFMSKTISIIISSLLIICAVALIFAVIANKKEYSQLMVFGVLISANTLLSLLAFLGSANTAEWLSKARLSGKAYLTTNTIFLFFSSAFLIWVYIIYNKKV